MAKKSETGTKKAVEKKSAPARKVGPKGMTFCTLASRDGMTLGVRTGKGILQKLENAVVEAYAPRVEVVAGGLVVQPE